MIDIKIVDYLSGKAGIKNKGLIEKDLILHSLLVGFAKDKYFSKNFVFKGGTCLIKCYLGYYRFSEDLDFTYVNQNAFEQKSEKEIRRFLSSEINKLLGIVEGISKEHDLGFKADKENKKYVEFGGSNKFLTLKIWYTSAANKREQFIKIQLNYVDLFKYIFKKSAAKPLIEADEKEVKFLFPEYADVLLQKPKLIVYDAREILLEKVRAILTRKGIKARDFVDVFIITKKLNKGIREFKDDIIQKIQFMLKYEKYKQNLKEKIKIKKWIKAGEEEHLLLKPLKGFEPFLEKFYLFLNEIVNEIVSRK